MRRTLIIAVVLLVTVGRSEAFAWGCDGHRAVATIAERLISPGTLNAARAVLTASPVDSSLKRNCVPVPSDIVADVSTWADDQRAADPSTGGWHFVNIPRAIASPVSPANDCPRGNCIIDVIATQFQILKSPVDPVRKANALRFLIHFVADIHQPLHAITNGDRGGNCFPVAYYEQPPEEDERGNFSPNLHGVWDFSSIDRLMKTNGLADARALGDYIAANGGLPQKVEAQAPTKARVTSWAREAHALARSVAYGRLAIPAPIEPASVITLTSCKDNQDIGHRLLALHERVSGSYEQRSVPVIVSQLRLAGIRLAAALQAAFPGP